jgi:dUTP pyrophosphatase
MFRRSMDPIPLHQLDPSARLPGRATGGSFGYDLATVQDERVEPGETRVLPTGFALARDLPLDRGGGLAMLILPRSSLSLKYGLILPNAPGLVDADYAGPIGVLVHNLRREVVTVPAGTRIAQAVFVELRFPELRATGEADPARTRGGFGSTGV